MRNPDDVMAMLQRAIQLNGISFTNACNSLESNTVSAHTHFVKIDLNQCGLYQYQLSRSMEPSSSALAYAPLTRWVFSLNDYIAF